MSPSLLIKDINLSDTIIKDIVIADVHSAIKNATVKNIAVFSITLSNLKSDIVLNTKNNKHIQQNNLLPDDWLVRKPDSN